jgi:hypothetical protein
VKFVPFPPLGMYAYFIVPTGKCIIMKRGGAPAPWAAASMFWSRISRHEAPPMAERNERRANL